MRWEIEGNVRFGNTPEEKIRRAKAIAAAKEIYGATKFAFIAKNPAIDYQDYDCSDINDLISLTGSAIRVAWVNERDSGGQSRNPQLFFYLSRITWAFYAAFEATWIPQNVQVSPNQLELFSKEEIKS